MEGRPLLLERPGLLLPLGIGIVALVAAGIAVQPPGSFGSLYRPDAIRYIGLALGAGALYAAAVWLVRRAGAGRAGWVVPFILATGLAARLLVLAAPPLLSTDIYRYVWDGRVQAAGINPYRHIPNDPALAALRDAGSGPAAVYPNINRADSAPTIYPPAAQALFAAIGIVLPGVWTMKAAMLAFDMLTAGVALRLLRAAGRPSAQVLIWAWNPLVIWEFAGAGHIDAMACALSALAMWAAIRSRPGWAGAALGLAVLTKLLPAALFPALWRRWDWQTPVAAGAVIVAGYACYASAGTKVLGYLTGYAAEEELDAGGGFLLPRLLRLAGTLPSWTGAAYAALALLILAGLAVWTVREPLPLREAARADVIGRDALILSAALLVLLSPHYPWYLTMLVLPAVLAPAWCVLWPTITGPLLYLDFARHHVLWPAIVFLPALPLLWADLRFRGRMASIVAIEGGS